MLVIVLFITATTTTTSALKQLQPEKSDGFL